MLQIAFHHQTYTPGMENIKRPIIRSPLETSTHSNFGINNENLIVNITETDDPLYIDKNEDDPLYIDEDEDSVQLSQDCLSINKTPPVEKADHSSNNLFCMQSSSPFEQNKSNSLLPPTCNMEGHLGLHNMLNSTSSTSSICKTQSEHGDMPRTETMNQATDTSSKFPASTYNINAEKENFVCRYCRKKFFRKHSLEKHLQSHMKSRHVCHIPECGRSFHNEANLLRHFYDYGKRVVCLTCKLELLCPGSRDAHVEYHKNLEQKKSENGNSDSSQALQSISPSTSSVPTTNHLSTNVCSNSTESNVQLSIPTATSETNLSLVGPVNSECQSNNLDYTIRESMDTSEAQSSERVSLPSMPSDMPNIKTKIQPEKKFKKLQTSNCSIDDEKENVVCPYCKKKFQHRQSLIMHIKLHRLQYTCPVSDCGRTFSQKENLKKHLYDKQKRDTCLLCNRTFLCKGNWAAHLDYHTNLERTKPKDDNNDSSQASQSISSSTSLASRTNHLSTNIELYGKANVCSNSTESNVQHLIPTATSEPNLSLTGPSNIVSQSNNADYTIHASVHTSKVQVSARDPLPSMSISTALLSLNNALLLEEKKSQNRQNTRCEEDSLRRHIKIHKKPKQKTKCPCLNCEAEGDNKLKDSNGRLLHICHVSRCGQMYNDSESFKRHLADHNKGKKYVCAECNIGFMRKHSLNRHVKIHISAKQNIFNNN